MNDKLDGLLPYVYDAAMTTPPDNNRQEIFEQEDIDYAR